MTSDDLHEQEGSDKDSFCFDELHRSTHTHMAAAETKLWYLEQMNILQGMSMEEMHRVMEQIGRAHV